MFIAACSPRSAFLDAQSARLTPTLGAARWRASGGSSPPRAPSSTESRPLGRLDQIGETGPRHGSKSRSPSEGERTGASWTTRVRARPLSPPRSISMRTTSGRSSAICCSALARTPHRRPPRAPARRAGGASPPGSPHCHRRSDSGEAWLPNDRTNSLAAHVGWPTSSRVR